MITTLFIISFLLHGVLLFIVLQYGRKKNSMKYSEQKEITALMQQFIEEIKLENEVLEQQLSKQVRHEGKRADTVETSKADEQTITIKKPSDDVAEAYEPSLEGQVYQLYESGMRTEEIAKHLERGKTEVELMIKFKENLCAR